MESHISQIWTLQLMFLTGLLTFARTATICTQIAVQYSVPPESIITSICTLFAQAQYKYCLYIIVCMAWFNGRSKHHQPAGIKYLFLIEGNYCLSGRSQKYYNNIFFQKKNFIVICTQLVELTKSVHFMHTYACSFGLLCVSNIILFMNSTPRLYFTHFLCMSLVIYLHIKRESISIFHYLLLPFAWGLKQ